jgi:hypothetical protein
MANVISALPPDRVLAGIQRLVEPIANDMAALLNGTVPDRTPDGKEPGWFGIHSFANQGYHSFICDDPCVCVLYMMTRQ